MTTVVPGELELYLFHEGRNFYSYQLMGAHQVIYHGVPGVRFCLWAPKALEVRVVGNFNNWQGDGHVMQRLGQDGIWFIFIPGLEEGEVYKYEILTPHGEAFLKSDPYAFWSELRPGTASRVATLNNYVWQDQKWQEQRLKGVTYESPVLIYEVHLGSWKRKNENFLSYGELADQLIDYVADMGYTHVEILPLAEHPLDGSWGYQATGYYSVTSRYGKPEDFMYFVDRCHQRGIGVILDWVPGHFCKDNHGLRRFDGSCLYEGDNWQRAENFQWGTLNFDFSKPEVVSFLISNAVFWFEQFHVDGLRVDAVASMLYLDYGKSPGQWAPNRYGGKENLEAVNFMKQLNETIFAYFPYALMIAEESTQWPQVTGPTYLGGLGYNYKWNMGWMNDILRYMEMDPVHRKWHHNLLTFSFMYTFSENFILPLSHDEVVHEKKSLLNKMPGDYWQKFANLRLLYGYMMAHPGKKLLFMGGEFGQFKEWNYNQSLDWNLMEYDQHQRLKDYMKQLNLIYINEKSLWELDHRPQGFQWIDPHDYSQSVITFMRKAKDSQEFIIIICNFTPVVYEHYRIGVPKLGDYRELLNSDRDIYGGSHKLNGKLTAEDMPWHNQPYSLVITLPPLATVYIKPNNL